jgi:hypothetical protein
MFPLPIVCLLADNDARLEGLSRTFRSTEPGVGVFEVALLVAGVLVIAVGFGAVTRVREFLRGNSRWNAPLAVFVGLCRAHRLSWRETFLLWRLAQWHGLDAPGRIFLEPERFNPEGLGPSLSADAEVLKRLKSQIFEGVDENPEETKAAASAPAATVPLPDASGGMLLGAPLDNPAPSLAAGEVSVT